MWLTATCRPAASMTPRATPPVIPATTTCLGGMASHSAQGTREAHVTSSHFSQWHMFVSNDSCGLPLACRMEAFPQATRTWNKTSSRRTWPSATIYTLQRSQPSGKRHLQALHFYACLRSILGFEALFRYRDYRLNQPN